MTGELRLRGAALLCELVNDGSLSERQIARSSVLDCASLRER